MADQQDIIVIGAGLIGLCTADALHMRGARVRVIDARPGPCEGTSFSNSGMIHPSQAMSWDPNGASNSADDRARLDAARVTARLGERSKVLLLERMQSLGMVPRSEGCLQLHKDMDSALKAQAGYNDIGIEADVLMNQSDTYGLPACYFPNDTSGDAKVFGGALAEDLSLQGVSFIYDAIDLDIRHSEDQFFVRTSRGVFAGDHLVIAGGAGSADCLARLGVRMKLEAIAGAAADFDLPADLSDFPMCPVMDTRSRSALTVFSDRIRISGGWGLDDPEPFLDRWHDIAPALMLRLGPPRSKWTGLRPVTPVGRPYISCTSVPKLWVNTGHAHMGWTLCAGSGELLANMLIEGVIDRRFNFLG